MPDISDYEQACDQALADASAGVMTADWDCQ